MRIVFSYAKLFISVVLALGYCFLPSFGYEFGGCLDGHLLYWLSHVNVWHLLVNILCLWLIPCDLHLLLCCFLSVLCSFLPCFVSEVTMGFSGVLFCIVGMSWGRVGRFREMIWKNKWFLVIPLFFPHVNGFIHIYCMLSGWLAGWSLRGSSYMTSRLRDWL